MFKLTQIDMSVVWRTLHDKTKRGSHMTERTPELWWKLTWISNNISQYVGECGVSMISSSWTPWWCHGCHTWPMHVFVCPSVWELQQTLIMRLEAETVITGVNTKQSSSPFLSVSDASLSAFCHPVEGGQHGADVMTSASEKHLLLSHLDKMKACTSPAWTGGGFFSLYSLKEAKPLPEF